MHKKLCLGLLAVILSAVQGESLHAAEKPNIIIILTDDQGWGDVGVYGADDLETPHIDRLAEEGVRFTQFYAGAPICSPSRASLLTGKTPERAGVPGNVVASPGEMTGMPPGQLTIAELFKASGYRTALIGKWHLGKHPAELPNEQGFDHFFGHLGGCIDNWSHYYYWRGPNRHDLHLNGEEIYRDGEYFPDMMVQEAIDFIAGDEKPFLIYFAMNVPHYPYQGDAQWLAAYDEAGVPYPRNLYGAFVSTLDERIGRLMAYLDEEGLGDDTIVIFQTDHGHSTEERAHSGGGSAGPFRGAKFSLFEGGIRVPAIIRWRTMLAAGEVREQMAVAADWLPTLASLSGVSTAGMDLDGRDLSDVLATAGAPSPHETYYWSRGSRWAVRQGDWKLLFDPLDTTLTAKPPSEEQAGSMMLVYLPDDPAEQTNLAEARPEKVSEMLAVRQQWLARNAKAD